MLYDRGMIPITLLGLAAGALTTFSLVPQVMQIYKSRHTKDLSLNTYVILSTGVFLWIVYGIFIKDNVVIIANVLTFLLAISIVWFKMKYG